MVSLKGRVVVVTGASEGIGEAIVRRLAAEGMKVAALARREEMLMTLEDDLKAKGYSGKGYRCDIQSDSDVKSAFSRIEADLGPVTAVVNNAAVAKHIPLRDINLDDVKAIVNTNIIGTLACTRETLASIKKHSSDYGHIININSDVGHRDTNILESMAIYAASKRAITSLTQSLRNELKSSKIRVTSISPALVKTSMSSWFTDNYKDFPYLLPSDVADAVVYALSAPLNVNVSEMLLENI